MSNSLFVIAATLGALLFVSVAHAEDPPQFLLQWGTVGADSSQFDSPSGIATDSDGNVYVTDTGNNRIQKFSPTGAFIAMWGSTGSGNGEFVNPFGIAIDANDNVYVVEKGTPAPSNNPNNRVQKFSTSGGYITQWGHRGATDGLFRDPRGVATDADGYVYVADFNNSRIQKFTSVGLYVTQWGEFGADSGRFNQPHGVAADEGGSIFVADYSNSRIQKFSNSGEYLTLWGEGLGDGEYQFHYASAVAVDAEGYVYVVDRANWHVKKYDTNGVYLTQWGTWSSGDLGQGNFYDPMAITVDADGNVYVVDRNKVQKFGVAATGIAASPIVPELSLAVYPNPFNPATTISFTVPEAAPVSLVVFNATGRVVSTLVNGVVMSAGPHAVEFRPRGASGVYFTKLTVGGQSQTAKLVELQ